MAITGKWDAALYDAKHSFVWEKGRGLLELLAPRPGERILDLGCGTGQLTAEIAAAGATVVGADRSAEMVEQARQKFPDLEFQVADATQLKFSGEFDAVFSNAVLHWVPDAQAAAAGIGRALRPGGRFVAELGGKGNVANVGLAFSAAMQRVGVPEPPSPWFYPSIAEYAAILERAGLEVRQALLFDRPTPLEDGPAGLRNWVAMFGGWYLKTAGERREQFLSEVEAAARPALWQGDRWVLDYRRLRVVATKASGGREGGTR
ncbi:MAG TPA: methyltransferase domain-containing protein [Dongiaceae bacterium]|nr:methyltransferase domain-containing protein [Dongiaceae bacterium]